MANITSKSVESKMEMKIRRHTLLNNLVETGSNIQVERLDEDNFANSEVCLENWIKTVQTHFSF